MNNPSENPDTLRKTPSHSYPLISGVIAFFLGPICLLSSDSIGSAVAIILYALGLIVSLGLGIFGVLNSRKAVEPNKARKLAITGIALTLLSLWCPLVIWVSFAILPCGVIGC